MADLGIFEFLIPSGELSEAEKAVGELLARPSIQLVIVIVCLVLLIFLAFKAGFSLWIMGKLGMGEESETTTEYLSNNRQMWAAAL